MQRWLPFVLVLGLLLSGCASGTKTAANLEPIFNGKDLTGWKITDPNPWWTVKDGVLVGQNDPAKKGHVLETQKSYQDVLFQTEFRFSGEIDSGIMLRKPQIQVQIGVSRKYKKDLTASIYAHGDYPGMAKGVEALLKPGQWNTLRVLAKGADYTVWLNGEHVLDYHDEAFPGAAPIGLQIHGGVEMKVEFRNLQARALDTNASATAK